MIVVNALSAGSGLAPVVSPSRLHLPGGIIRTPEKLARIRERLRGY
jgi:hypothetical protein